MKMQKRELNLALKAPVLAFVNALKTTQQFHLTINNLDSLTNGTAAQIKCVDF